MGCLRTLDATNARAHALIAELAAKGRRVRTLGRAAEAALRKRARLGNAHDAALERCLERAPTSAAVENGRIRELGRRIGETAARIAGREASARCETAAAWPKASARRILGFVAAGTNRIHLAPTVCYALHRVSYLGEKPDLSCLARSRAADLLLCAPDPLLLVRAVTTVAHEAQHVAGIADEARAECGGLQATPRVARALGLAPAHARLVAWYASRFPYTPASYRSRSCPIPGALA